MRVKTFRGENAQAVLAKIKKELGPEAVILSNQTKREGGVSVCEIMAAVEEAAPAPVENTRQGNDLGLAANPGDPQWQREWSEMKSHLSALLRPHMNLDTLAPRQKLAMQYLEREGVDQAILIGLYMELNANKNASILAELGKIARVKPYDAPWAEKFHLVAGPSGIGKTTVLLRMALGCKRAGKDKRICLVNCDGHAGKGRAMLKRYAELAGISYMEADGPDDFTHVLLQCRNFDRIFVDLPALPMGATLQEWLSARHIDARDDVAVHLALSPVYGAEQLRAFWERYRCPRVQSVVWTKLDEACSFGSLINVASMTGLPVSALSYGPAVTSTMARAESQALWKLVFTRQMPGGAQAQPVEMAA